MSEVQEEYLAKMSLAEITNQFGHMILPPSHPHSRYVEEVAHRIINALDQSLVNPNTEWRVFVVQSPIANAFVLPGGEIFVFTGLLPIAANEDGLAAVLGHEVAFTREFMMVETVVRLLTKWLVTLQKSFHSISLSRL